MSLIFCPNCGGKLSDKAIKCPHCNVAMDVLFPKNSNSGLLISDPVQESIITNLSDFEINNGVLKKYLGEATEIYIPDCVEEICGNHSVYGTFEPEGCNIYPVFDESIEKVVLPEGLKKIGEFAFYGCKNLTTIYIPDSVQEICKSAFEYCSSLKHIHLPRNLRYIGIYAFSNCISLESVEIPHGVVSMGYDAFYGCSELKEIFIPKNTIDLFDSTEEDNEFLMGHRNYAPDNVPFINCHSMTTISVSNENPIYSSKDGLLYNRDKTQLMRCPEGRKDSITLTESIKEISENAFINCKNIEEIRITNTLPKDHPHFPMTVINYSIDLNEFQISDNVLLKYLGKRSQVIIPKSVIEISENAFSDCQHIKSVLIQEGVRKICKSAFENCRSLENISLSNSIENIEESAFADCSKLNHLSLPEMVIELKDLTFANCKNLSDISLPSKICSIGKFAFINCVELETILLPQTLKVINDFAFFGCVSLREIALPEKIEKISNSTFLECSNVTFICDEDSYAESYVMKKHLKAKIKCKYCGNMIEEIDQPCSQCGKWRNAIIPDNGIDIDHIKIGDCLKHKIFGEGKIVDIVNNTFTVDFGNEQKIFSKSSAERFFDNLYRIKPNIKITQSTPKNVSTYTYISDDYYKPSPYKGYYDETSDEWFIFENDED